jgi:hypothetical protein
MLDDVIPKICAAAALEIGSPRVDMVIFDGGNDRPKGRTRLPCAGGVEAMVAE